MSLISPETLNSGHCASLFDCGKPVLNNWLVRHARQAQASGSAKTFVVADMDRIVGYFSLTVGQVDTLEAPERIRKGMGQYLYSCCSTRSACCFYRPSGTWYWQRSPSRRYSSHSHDG